MFDITECLFTGRVNKIVFVSNFKTKRSFPRAPLPHKTALKSLRFSTCFQTTTGECAHITF